MLKNNFIGVALLLLVCVVPVSAQQRILDFLVFKGNNEVGKLRAIKTIEPNRIVCSLYSDVKINAIIEVNVIENIKNVFQNNELLSSTHKRFVNGNLKVDNTLSRKQNVYHVKQKNNSSNLLNITISKCVLSLYFEEPVLFTDVYSENFQEILKIRKIAEHRYILKLPNGNKAYYTYKSGLLHEVEAHTTWAIIRFVRSA